MPKRTRPAAEDTIPRQWALVRLMQSTQKGLTALQLANQLKTPKTNVERDLQVLTAAGFPIRSVQDPQHRQRLLYSMEADASRTTVGFGAAELLSLYAATSVLRFLANTPVHMDLESVLQKVRAQLADSPAKAVAGLANIFTSHLRDFVSYDDEERRAILDDLLDAMARTRKVRVEYQGADAKRAKPYTLWPLRVFAHHSALYFFAAVENRPGVRTFAVHRIQTLELLSETFATPKLDLDAHADSAFGVFIEEPQDVEILFAPETARYILERTFHPKEHKQQLEDGSVRYRVRAGGQHEMVAWVLSFGGAATLVTPVAWRREAADRARRAVAVHT